MIFRVAPEEDRDIFDSPVLGSVPVSQGHMGLSYLFHEETSDETLDNYDAIAGHGLICVQQLGSGGGSKDKKLNYSYCNLQWFKLTQVI